MIDRRRTVRTSTPSITPGQRQLAVRPLDVTLTIHGAVTREYPLRPVSTRPLASADPYPTIDGYEAVLGHANLTLATRPQQVRGEGYVVAELRAIHAHGCHYTHMRRGANGPCDCGAHQALAGLLAHGRIG